MIYPSNGVLAAGCSTNNVQGWAWSDNIGWISFSCLNEYEIGVGIDYGVNLNKSTGILTGQAWSDDVGWISFDSDDLTGCPSGGCEAKISGGSATGWAKIVGGDEWISLSGTAINLEEYGVEFTYPDFSGYAWGDETAGWISFNCADAGVCASSNYKVEVTTTQINIKTDSAVVSYDEGADTATVELQGRLTGMGVSSEVEVWFEWGETEGTIVKDVSTVQSVTEEGEFSAEITIASPVVGEVYYFRAGGEDASGEVYGLVKTFSLLTCNYNNIRGYAWSDNVGWISFSCLNEYNVGEGVDYGVNFSYETNLLSGYAWSGIVGWISFEEDDLVGCPEAPCEARVEITEASGWAKVLDSDEWISLSGTAINLEEYGVEFVSPDFSGYAWGDGIVGWVTFNCIDEGVCSTIDYKVYVTQLTLLARTDPAVVIYNKEDAFATIILNGMLLGMGAASEVDVWFEWSDDSNSLVVDGGTLQTMTDTGAFASEVVINTPEQGKTYYFRAMAESIERKAQGTILNFEISRTDGDIIIRYKGDQKTININSGGRIEVN
ncbi:MAG: hypothetical protein PF549_01485 [Patescibacteria group bacterium]|nr:hypothetical protein [Patescibacteria group bacterium]